MIDTENDTKENVKTVTLLDLGKDIAKNIKLYHTSELKQVFNPDKPYLSFMFDTYSGFEFRTFTKDHISKYSASSWFHSLIKVPNDYMQHFDKYLNYVIAVLPSKIAICDIEDIVYGFYRWQHKHVVNKKLLGQWLMQNATELAITDKLLMSQFFEKEPNLLVDLSIVNYNDLKQKMEQSPLQFSRGYLSLLAHCMPRHSKQLNCQELINMLYQDIKHNGNPDLINAFNLVTYCIYSNLEISDK